MALESTGLLTQDADRCGTTLVDARNEFNDMKCLAILWTVRQRWTAGAKFTLNCYRRLVKLLLCQPGDAPLILLGREGVTQVDPLSMVRYGITLVPPEE